MKLKSSGRRVSIIERYKNSNIPILLSKISLNTLLMDKIFIQSEDRGLYKSYTKDYGKL